MTPDSSPCQKSGQPGCPTGNKDETRAPMVRDDGLPAIHETEARGRDSLLQRLLAHDKMVGAWERVEGNRECAGIGGPVLSPPVIAVLYRKGPP
ncbi:hypothetical protein DNV77_20285 [Salmonella enterica subsp. enterica]|nr:hypothetical protein [Salmonella enterica subsp. enterica]